MEHRALVIGTLLSVYTVSGFSGEMDFLSVNGYGTLGGAYQDNKEVLYPNRQGESRRFFF